jgi:hypothetical protein
MPRQGGKGKATTVGKRGCEIIPMKARSYPGEKGVLGAEFQVVESIHYNGLEREEY